MLAFRINACDIATVIMGTAMKRIHTSPGNEPGLCFKRFTHKASEQDHSAIPVIHSIVLRWIIHRVHSKGVPPTDPAVRAALGERLAVHEQRLTCDKWRRRTLVICCSWKHIGNGVVGNVDQLNKTIHNCLRNV